MKKWIGFRFVVLVLCAVVIFGCGKTMEQQIIEQLELGQKYLTEQNYEEAIVAFDKVIEFDPKNIDGYLSLSEAYVKSNNLSNAIHTLTQGFEMTEAEEIKKELIARELELGERYMDGNDYQSAVETFQNILRISPDDEKCGELIETAMQGLAEHYIEQADDALKIGNTESALEFLQKAYEITKTRELEIRILALQNGGEYEDDNGNAYDGYGTRKKRVYYDSQGNLIFYFQYEYDEKGELVRVNEYSDEGVLIGYEIRKKEGLRLYSESFDGLGARMGKSVRVENEDGKWMYTSCFDDNDNEITCNKAVYDAGGNYLGWDVYESNELVSKVRQEGENTVYYDKDENISMYSN